ncbi:MAG: hypothetical protein ACE5OP_01610 [Candidatus Glassbacteria bacterium]
MSRLKVWIITLILTVSSFASRLGADTIFASRSLGSPIVQVDGRSWGMGGVSVAMGGENFSTTNPAIISNFYRSGFTGMLIPEYRQPEDETGRANLRSFQIPVVRAIFPLRKKFIASGGIKQSFDMNWRFDREREFDGESLGEYLSSEGSLFSIHASVARPIGRKVSLGAEIEIHRGEATRTWFLEASQPEGGASGLSSRDVVRRQFSGESLSIGLLLHPYKWFDVGMSFRPGFKLDIDETLEAGTGLTQKRSDSVDVPYSLILGFAVQSGRRLTVGLDFESSPWRDLKASESFPFPMKDYKRLSIGLEFTPSRDPLAPFWKRWPLRTGLMFRTLPADISGKSINELSYMLGVGIIVGDGRGRLDFFTQYATRGNLEEFGIQERVIRFGFSVSGFEKWVPKRKGRRI